METNALSKTQATRVLRLPEVIKMVGLGRASIYDYIKAEKFPAPIQLGSHSVGWLLSEVESWLDERIQARNEKREVI